MEYKYTLKSWEASSQKYGNCEVCGQHVTEIYHQTEERKYFDPMDNGFSYTRHNCTDLIGHKDCLVSQRR